MGFAMRIATVGVLALGLLAAGCGTNEDQRASTGALTGAGAGAVIGGPIGALAGAAIGAVGGSALPEGADQIYASALNRERPLAQNALNGVGLGPSATPQVQQAQLELQREGLYQGRIDGIMGPETRQALRDFQQREGLRQTASLDRETLDRLNQAAGSATAQNNQPNAAERSGTTTPPAMMSREQLRQELQQEGYSNISDLRRQSDNTYTAHAQRGDQTLSLRINAQNGQVISERGIAGHAKASGENSPGGPSTSNDAGATPSSTR
jgi:hypothetical protein